MQDSGPEKSLRQKKTSDNHHVIFGDIGAVATSN
jgi:hypothetical protein